MQTSQKSIFDIIEETSTSSAAASPANPTQAQANDLEKKMTATSGQRCCDAFERFSHVGSWAKTFSALLIGMEGWYSKRCKLTWKLKGTKSNRMYFQLQASTLHTEGIESGLLLTPTSVMTDEPPEKMRERAERNGYKNGTQYGEMLPTPTTQEPTTQCELTESGRRKTKDGKDSHSLNLGRVVAMLPTPTTDSATNRKEKYKQGGTPLTVAVNKMLPTPATRDANNAEYPDKYAKRKEYQKSKGVNLEYPLRQFAMDCNPTGKTSQLNPLFVEEMMGFPTDWTILPFLSGETNPSKDMGTQ